jgi:hypothetical protein
MTKCQWITKKKTPCTKDAFNGNMYCPTHSHYEGVYTPEDIPKLKKCSTCTQFVVPNDITKQCPLCFKKNPIRICKWMARSGKKCSRSSLQGKTCCKTHAEFEDENIGDYLRCTQCRLMYHSKYTKCNRCYPQDIRCKALNKNGTPCTNTGRAGHMYCGFHARYEGIITPGEFKDLPICSGCHSYFKPSGEYKRCDECRERVKTIQPKRKLCNGLTHTGTPCKNQALTDDEYCGEHQSYKKWKSFQDMGVSVCSNWVRGCWNITTDTGFMNCEKCRIHDRVCERNIRIKREERSKSCTDDCLVCIGCGNTKHKDEFVSEIIHYTSDGPKESVTKRCKQCRDSMKQTDDKRSERERTDTRTYSDRPKTYAFNLGQRYHSYKAKDRIKKRLNNGEKTIEQVYAYKLMKMPCSYCGSLPTNTIPNGLDRLDNSKGHSKGNVVPCCETCNMMKGTLGVKRFREHCERITKHTRQTLV